MAVADKKIIEVAINEMTAITGQKAVATISRKDIANFKLRKKMPNESKEGCAVHRELLGIQHSVEKLLKKKTMADILKKQHLCRK